MTLKIENYYQKNFFLFNVESKIRELLDFIPNEHLVGLEKILVVDEIRNNKAKNAAGIYNQKHGSEPATIEISVDSVYRKMPKLFFFLPFIAKFLLADVLYHEIGHHYHHNYKHGVKKNRREIFAENYRKEMMKKAFRWWIFFLRPISPLIRYLAKVVNK